ncbi:MAG: Crp/Fnr family transcriptional regulator [Clostridia bacterium]|nr:Crp/Fnr family transcriptional regulator [Clostridia bacterium]
MNQAGLDTFFLFQGLNEEEQTTLLQTAPPAESFPKGAVIYSTRQFRRAIGLVVRGTVVVSRTAAVLNRLGPGGVFGAAALFGQDTSYVTEITAATACEVRFFDEELLRRWMREDPRLAENYIGFLSDRVRFLNRRIAAFTAGDATERLLTYLHQHADEEGLVNLPRSMTELAHMLDMGRSSLYRSLDDLAAAGRIRREGKWIYIL